LRRKIPPAQYAALSLHFSTEDIIVDAVSKRYATLAVHTEIQSPSSNTLHHREFVTTATDICREMRKNVSEN